MPAAKLNIVIEQGSDFVYELEFKDSEGDETDITGWTGEGMVRRNYDDSEVAAEILFEVINGPLGIAKLSIPNLDTALIEVDPSEDGAGFIPTVYVYDVEVTYPDTTKEKILRGYAKVIPEITR